MSFAISNVYVKWHFTCQMTLKWHFKWHCRRHLQYIDISDDILNDISGATLNDITSDILKGPTYNNYFTLSFQYQPLSFNVSITVLPSVKASSPCSTVKPRKSFELYSFQVKYIVQQLYWVIIIQRWKNKNLNLNSVTRRNQDSPPAWMQEAYRPPHSKHSCAILHGGGGGSTPSLARGYPILTRGYPNPCPGGTPSWLGPILGLGYPSEGTWYQSLGYQPRKGPGTSHWGTSWKGNGTSGSIMGWKWGKPPPRVWTGRQLWKQYLPVVLRTQAVINTFVLFVSANSSSMRPEIPNSSSIASSILAWNSNSTNLQEWNIFIDEFNLKQKRKEHINNKLPFFRLLPCPVAVFYFF